MIIFAGALGGKFKILNSDSTKTLSELLMKITFPITLIASTNIEGGTGSVSLMMIAFAIFMGFYGLCILIGSAIAKAAKLPHGKSVVFKIFTLLPNSLFIAMPLITGIFGAEGMTAIAAGSMAYNLVFFTYAIYLFNNKSKFDPKIFIAPGNIATLIMIIMLLFNIKLPPVLQNFADVLGGATTPIALIIIGVLLVQSDISQILKNKFLYAITFMRCFFYPVLLAVILSFTSLDRTMCMSMVLITGCAAGTLGAVLAKQTNVEPELSGMAVAQTTLMLAVSLPLVAFIAQLLLY